MNKNIKQIISITLLLALFAGCFATLPIANAVPAPVPGNPSWDAKYAAAKVIAPALGPASDIPNNPRDNASGDKITSNAHSADYPGIYFYWNDKQKDNGVLLVNPEVFDMFVGGKFTLTAKNSNNYWGYTISKATGTLIDGVYAFGIEKQIKYNEIGNNGKVSAKTDDLKNINMVFIDGEYKSGYFVIGKVFYNEVGRVYGTGDSNIDIRGMIRESRELPGLYDLVSFNNGYKIGVNEVKITDYKSAVYGKTITVTENDIEGFLPQEKSIKVTVTWNTLPTITFYNQKQWANIVIEKIWLDVEGNEIADTAGLEAAFTINGKAANLGDNQVKAGTYIVKEVSCTKGYSLTSENNIKVIVAAGKTENVTFTNEADKTADIYIYKQWINENGNDIAAPAGVTATLTNDWVFMNVNDAPISVAAGTAVSFKENDLPASVTVEFRDAAQNIGGPYSYVWNPWTVARTWTEGNREYTEYTRTGTAQQDQAFDTLTTSYEFVSVSINDVVSDVNEVDFTAKGGETYTIIFTNKVIVTPGTDSQTIEVQVSDQKIESKLKELPPIESDSHVAKWWAENGISILAYGAQTTDAGDYFVAFDLSRYSSVTVGFGSSAAEASKNTVTFPGSEYKTEYVGGNFATWIRQYINGNGWINSPTPSLNVDELAAQNLTVFWIPNPHGSGAMQIYLIDYVEA